MKDEKVPVVIVPADRWGTSELLDRRVVYAFLCPICGHSHTAFSHEIQRNTTSPFYCKGSLIRAQLEPKRIVI